MNDDPRLDELEIDCVTITRDAQGEVVVDGGGLTNETISHMLVLATYVHAACQFYDGDEDEDEGV